MCIWTKAHEVFMVIKKIWVEKTQYENKLQSHGSKKNQKHQNMHVRPVVGATTLLVLNTVTLKHIFLFRNMSEELFLSTPTNGASDWQAF